MTPMLHGLRRRDGLLLLVCLGLGLACIRLGFWQLDRLEQRRARNARMEARLAMPPVQLTGAPLEAAAMEYRHVTVHGTFDLAAQVILVNRALDGVPGVHLLAPLLLEGSGEAVLVDRGWIPVEDQGPGERTAYASEGPVELTGIARLTQPEPFWTFLRDPLPAPGGAPLDSWRVVNLQGLQSQMPAPLLPVFLEQSEALAVGQQPVPDPEIDRSEGPHLSYAIQWFSFAAIAIVGGGAWFRHRKRGQTAGGGTRG